MYHVTNHCNRVFLDIKRSEPNVQRALYFTLPSLGGASISRTASISRIPIDIEVRREMAAVRRDISGTGRSFDVSYAEPDEYNNFGESSCFWESYCCGSAVRLLLRLFVCLDCI